jgi:chromosome segregation ATPase
MTRTSLRTVLTVVLGVVCFGLLASGCGTEKLGKKEYSKRMKSAIEKHEKRAEKLEEGLGEDKKKMAKAFTSYGDSLDDLHSEISEFEPDDSDAAKHHANLLEGLEEMSGLIGDLSKKVEKDGLEALDDDKLRKKTEKAEKKLTKASEALAKDKWVPKDFGSIG